MNKHPPDIRLNKDHRSIVGKRGNRAGCRLADSRKLLQLRRSCRKHTAEFIRYHPAELFQIQRTPVIPHPLPCGKHLSIRSVGKRFCGWELFNKAGKNLCNPRHLRLLQHNL